MAVTPKFFWPVAFPNDLTIQVDIGAGLRTAVSVGTLAPTVIYTAYMEASGGAASIPKVLEVVLNAAVNSDVGFNPGFKFTNVDATAYPGGGMLGRRFRLVATTPSTMVDFKLNGAGALAVLGGDGAAAGGLAMNFPYAFDGCWFAPSFYMRDYRAIPRDVTSVSVSQTRAVSVVKRRRGAFRSLRFEAMPAAYLFSERANTLRPDWLNIEDGYLGFEWFWREAMGNGLQILASYDSDENSISVNMGSTGSYDFSRMIDPGAIADMSTMVTSRELDVGGDVFDLAFELELVSANQIVAGA